MLDKHVRYILIVYPVVIWALSGNLDKNYDPESPNRNGIFIGRTKIFIHSFIFWHFCTQTHVIKRVLTNVILSFSGAAGFSLCALCHTGYVGDLEAH